MDPADSSLLNTIICRTTIRILFDMLETLDIITVLKIVSRWTHLFKAKNVEDCQDEENRQRVKTGIKDGITLNTSRVVIAWCPMGRMSPDFFATAFGAVDPRVKVNARWSKMFVYQSRKPLFDGVVAMFTSEELALDARKEISVLSKSVMTIQLSQMLDFFVEAEAYHGPHYGAKSTCVSVYASKSLCIEKNRSDVRDMLSHYGDVVDVTFCPLSMSVSHMDLYYICDVTYAYATHAYAAKFHLDGFFHRGVGKFSVSVYESLKEKEMLKSVKRRLIQYLDENRTVPARS